MKHRLFQAVIAGCAALALAGCATTTRTETRRAYVETQDVNPGDQVKVTTKDGQKHEFRVKSADAKTIKGKNIEVAREDLTSIKTVQTVTVKTEETSAQPAVQAVSTVAIVWGIICVVAIAAVF